MAVHLFTGTLGNGKTLSAMQKFFEWAWLKGGYVFTNVSVNWDECKKHAREVYGVELQDSQCVLLTHDQVAEFHNHVQRGTREVPVVLCVDECGKFFNSKAWNVGLKGKMTCSDFIRESRKLHVEIIFIVQNEERLDKSFREIMEYRWEFRALKWIPILRRFTIQRQLHADTDVCVNSRWWWRDARLYKCYDTDTTYSAWSCAELPELQPIPFDKKPKKPLPLMTKVMFLCALVYGCWSLISGITKNFGGAKIAKPQLVQSAAPVASVPVAVSAASSVPQDKVIVEPFRGTDYRTFLRTSSGEYFQGQWCQYGRVHRIGFRSCDVVGMSGEKIVIVARDFDDPGKVAAVASQVAAEAARVGSPAPSSVPGEMSASKRALGGYPSTADAEKLGRAMAGMSQDSAVSSPPPVRATSAETLPIANIR